MVSYHRHRALIALFSTITTTRAGAFSASSAIHRLRGGNTVNSLLTNLPSSCSSIGSRLNSNINGEEEDEEPRTGWLHNTEPKYSSYPSSTSSSDPTLSLAMKRLLADRMRRYRNHRIINPPAAHPCGDSNRMMVTEHKIAIPLTHPDLKAAKMEKKAQNQSSGGSNNKQRIAPVERIDAAFFSGNNGNEAFDEPTIDVYFTIIELLSNKQDEEHFHALCDTNLSPSQRAELYFQKEEHSAIDPSRTMIYLQGGPGFGCASPVSGLSLASSSSSWAGSLLIGGKNSNVDGKSFERILLMDQRGTGKSSPISKQQLAKIFPDLFILDNTDDSNKKGNVVGEEFGSEDNTDARMMLLQARQSKALSEATEYLSLFRADSIVRDAEWIREALCNPFPSVDEEEGSNTGPKARPFGAALGQSFGGFCSMTYLSSIAHPPEIMLFTGGIAPMNTPIKEVYDRLWVRVRERSWKYYEQYPGDVARVKKIVRTLLSHENSVTPIKLPSGGILTARRFLQLGLALGGSPGVSFNNLHGIINSAFVDEDSDELSNAFLKRIDYEQSFDDAPLYFLLHESIYADGDGVATQWAAHRSYESHVQSNAEFDYRLTSNEDNANPTLFFGEMVFPFMAHGDFNELSNCGMRMLSEALAEKSDWLPLFDQGNMRSSLLGPKKKTRAASATYYDDMYVDFECAMTLVQRGGPMEGVRVYVTNEYQHSGLRDDGANIVNKLFAMAKNQLHVPS